jgi:hypothetical protein
MTAPTPKPDAPPAKAPPRGFRLPRPAALAIAATLAFTIFAVALIRVLPAPHTRADYLIVGTLATLAALIAIFAGLVMGRGKR